MRGTCPKGVPRNRFVRAHSYVYVHIHAVAQRAFLLEDVLRSVQKPLARRRRRRTRRAPPHPPCSGWTCDPCAYRHLASKRERAVCFCPAELDELIRVRRRTRMVHKRMLIIARRARTLFRSRLASLFCVRRGVFFLCGLRTRAATRGLRNRRSQSPNIRPTTYARSVFSGSNSAPLCVHARLSCAAQSHGRVFVHPGEKRDVRAAFASQTKLPRGLRHRRLYASQRDGGPGGTASSLSV